MPGNGLLSFHDRACRAGTFTCAAIDAFIRIDLVLGIAHADRLYGAISCTCSTADAFICNNSSHYKSSLFSTVFIFTGPGKYPVHHSIPHTPVRQVLFQQHSGSRKAKHHAFMFCLFSRSAFINFVYSGSHASFTVPIGPFLCLARITSHIPDSSESL